MASITVQERTTILKLVAGMFNAAPGATLLSGFSDAFVAMNKDYAALATALSESDAFKSLYPSFLTAEEFANKFLDTLGLKADTNAQDWVKAKVTAGESYASVIFQALVAIDASTDEQFKAAREQLANKATVAEYYSVEQNKSADDLDTLQGVLAGVTNDPATVEAAKQGAAVATGQTFTLTANVDNVQGTAGNDTIIAGPGSAGGVHTLGASDVINGGAGTDQIIITSEAVAAGETLVPRMSGVEQVFAQAVGAGTTTINMINATGVQELWNNNSTSNLSVTNLQEKATIGIKGGNGGNSYSVQAAAAALTGDLTVALDGAVVNNLVVNATGIAGAPGYTSTTINTATGTNAISGLAGTQTSQITALDVGNTLATVKVVGDGAVRVVGDLAATVRTIDASANKGGVNLSITNNTGNVTFTGGEGADRINFGGTLNLNDKVDGGAGRDILGVTNETSIIAGLQVSNVEILELAALNGTLEAARIAGVDEVRVTNTLNNTSGTAVVNGLTSNSTFVTNSSGDVRLNITNAQVAGTNDTLNLKTGITGVGGSVNVMAAGVENVVYTQNNAATTGTGATTTVNFYDTDSVIDMTKLTIANNAGNTVNFNNLVNTIRTVDASDAAGNVNVSIANGNPTNGVSITGGSGNDRLIGGSGKDIIVGGAGNDFISGEAYTVTPNAAQAQETKVTFVATYDVGDKVSVTFNGTTYNHTVVSGATTANDVWTGLLGTGLGSLQAALAAANVSNAFNANVVTLTGVAGAANTFTVEAAIDNSADVASVPASQALGFTGSGLTQATNPSGSGTSPIGTQATADNAISLVVNGTSYSFTIQDTSTVTTDDGSGNATGWTHAYSVTAATAAQLTAAATAMGATASAINSSTGAITFTANTGDLTQLTHQISSAAVGGDASKVQLAYTPATGPADQAAPVVATTQDALDAGNTYALPGADIAASDILTGGEGNDTFFFAGQSGGWNGSKLVNMDTITDLNLGGASSSVGVDTLQFNKGVLGYTAFGATALINGGSALNMTGPTFEAALQGLFNAGGSLNGSTGNVGLFNYGSDTYLIVTDSAAGLNANDIVIKVTGVAGTLDLSDLTIV